MSVSLKDYGVGSVFAIDDDFDNYVNGDTILNEELIDNITKNTGANLEEYKDILTEQGDIHEGLKISDIETGSDIVAKIKRELDNRMSLLYRLLMKEYGVNFKQIGTRPHEDWAHIQEIINEIKVEMKSQNDEGKYVLVVMDKKLQGEGSENLLYNYLNEIAKLLKEKSNILLVMYSSEPENFEDYDSVIEHLKEKMESSSDESVPHILALHLNYISKEINDETELKELLVRYVLKSQKSAFLNIYKESFDIADNKLREKLWDSDKDKNRALFYYDYLSEGQHVDDIIFDLFINKFRSVVNEKINHNHTILINPLRKSMQRFTESYSNDNRMLFLRFQKELLLRLSCQVFEPISSSDITFGDIVEVNLEQDKEADSQQQITKHYMVVGQECDLTVRYDGTRVLDTVQLVEVDLKKEQITSSWLIQQLTNYLSSKYKNASRKSVYEMFSDFDSEFKNKNSNVSSFFCSLGFDSDDVNKILASIDDKTQKIGLKKGDLNDKEVNSIRYYDISKSRERINIETIWLDALTLRKNGDGHFVLSKDEIERAHEIRRPLREYMSKKYGEIEKKLLDLVLPTKQARTKSDNDNVVKRINQILDFTLEKSKFKVHAQKVSEDQLELKIINAKRIGRLDYIVARDLHHKSIEHQTRIGGSSTPGI